jgi:4-hydroxybutyrate dehydrogenase
VTSFEVPELTEETIFTWGAPPLKFGAGAIDEIGFELTAFGVKRVLIVTDPGVNALGAPQRLADTLKRYEIESEVFDGVHVEPTDDSMNKATEYARAQGPWDGFVAVGGGSAIDTAKAINLLTSYPGELMDYINKPIGNAKVPPGQLKPLIAVPTTAGTGSEVARGAIVIVDDGRKLGFHSWHLVPKTALLDPDLTLGLPAFLTAATGMDAIAHCMETFMAPAVNPPADGIGLDGLERAWKHIERATRDGGDREARWNMMSASMQGALAFQKGLGCVHSLSHSLGGVNPKLHHGTLNAMFLPEVVRFNASAGSMIKDRRLARMAHAMGLPEGDDGGETIAAAIRALNSRLGLPSGLAALGVTAASYERIVDGAMADHCHKTNPRLATRDDYVRMLEASM